MAEEISANEDVEKQISKMFDSEELSAFELMEKINSTKTDGNDAVVEEVSKGPEEESLFDRFASNTEEIVNQEVEVNDNDLLAGAKVGLMYAFDKFNVEHNEAEISKLSEQEVSEYYDALIDSQIVETISSLKEANPEAGQLLTLMENGADLKTIVTNLYQRYQNENVTLSTEEDKLVFLSKFYKDSLGFEDDIFDRKMVKLKANPALIDDELEVAIPQYNKILEKQAAQYEQDLIEKEKRAEQLNSSLSLSVLSRAKQEGYSSSDLGLLERSIKNDVNTPYGVMKEIDAKILEMRQSEEGLFLLASFVTDPKKYNERVGTKQVNTLQEKQFAASKFKSVLTPRAGRKDFNLSENLKGVFVN